ncbi:acidic leucine-rich nuclear phosphoprotein 32 family member A-like isoform X2 [Halichondria panicea]|uniref:acidic leucine-rich nuclear phosphoprotein 32 family member A-like isoform X2 n=1 Tax=Halichondria panicea TaxID=6063 RepID=UPI00312BB8C3
MEDAIASQQKDRKPGEIEELYLDNVQSPQISGLSDEYTRLQKLSVVNCGLSSLEGLPKLPSLEKLLLSDNRLSGGLDNLARCNGLKKLVLAGNKISNLEELKPLSKLSGLLSLDLYNCPVTSIENYRDQIFELLISLNSLDGLDRSGEEVEDSEGDDEEEESEAEGSESDEEGPGLDYLLNNELNSDSSGSENEYDPDNDDAPPDDDFIVLSDDEEDRDDGSGPSQPKRPKLDPPPEQDDDESDSD